MSIEDAFEMFIEAFDSQRTEFVKEATHFHAWVGMGIGSVPSDHQLAE